MVYLFLKDTHNILRWLVIFTCLWALFRVWSGLLAHGAWSKKDRIAGVIFTSILNLQFIIGLLLLFTGPMRAAFSNMSGTMKDPVMRFFVVEHPFMMLLAVIIAQVGFSLSKRAGTDRAKFLRATICYTISAILIFASIPWPFMKAARPLLPSFLG
jgi:hypothetical protein